MQTRICLPTNTICKAYIHILYKLLKSTQYLPDWSYLCSERAWQQMGDRPSGYSVQETANLVIFFKAFHHLYAC